MAGENIGGRWFVLMLNDMRNAKAERVRPVVRAREREALHRLIGGERVETYDDGRWRKAYRRGGPLEWQNEPVFSGGIVEVFVVTDAPLDVQILTEAQAADIATLEQLVAPEVG